MSKTKCVSDPAHSEILFKVKHLMITTVTGYFKIFKVEVETETDDFNTTSNILFTAAINSIETTNIDRNKHLVSADFFNAEKYPELKFVTKKYEGNGDEVKLHGDLTIRDTTSFMAAVLILKAGRSTRSLFKSRTSRSPGITKASPCPPSPRWGVIISWFG